MNFITLIATYGIEIPIIMALIAAASTYTTYAAQNAAAKRQATQAQMNADAQAAAADSESKRQAQEQAEAARRKVMEQRRFRQTQLAAISGQGIQLTGTPLDILADTAVQQGQELADLSYSGEIAQRDIANHRQNALAAGQNNAAMALAGGPNKGATILAGASQAISAGYGAYQNTPRAASGGETRYSGGQIHGVSQRPY